MEMMDEHYGKKYNEINRYSGGSLRGIIIIKNGRQCKAGRERFTPCYQCKDPSPTIPTN